MADSSATQVNLTLAKTAISVFGEQFPSAAPKETIPVLNLSHVIRQRRAKLFRCRREPPRRHTKQFLRTTLMEFLREFRNAEFLGFENFPEDMQKPFPLLRLSIGLFMDLFHVSQKSTDP